MAIVRSHSMGEARKSAGLITYRNSRGRVIASQKRRVFTDTEKTALRKTARAIAFKVASQFAAANTALINQSFTRTKYGSSTNAFVKINYSGFVAAILYGAADNLQLVTDPTKTWADVKSVENISMADAVSVVDNYTTDNETGFVRAHLSGESTVYVPRGATFVSTVVDNNPSVTSLSAVYTTDDTQSTATAIKIVGRNLASSLVIKIGGVTQTGAWSEDFKTFTLTTPYKWADNKVFAVYDADGNLLYSKSINGAPSSAPKITSMTVDGASSHNCTGLTLVGSNLSDAMSVTVNGSAADGAWSDDYSKYTFAKTYVVGINQTMVFAVLYDGQVLRSVTVTNEDEEIVSE